MTGPSWRIALVLGLAMAASGCGSDPGGENGAVPPASADVADSAAVANICVLVTREEVAAAIGEPVVDAESNEGTCSYKTRDSMASSVELELTRPGGAKEMQVALDSARLLGNIGGTMSKGSGAEAQAGEAMAEGGAVPGLGDQAFFGTNQQLHVLKGDTYFAVSPPAMRSRTGGGSPLLSADQKQAMARAIAEKVLTRL